MKREKKFKGEEFDFSNLEDVKAIDGTYVNSWDIGNIVTIDAASDICIDTEIISILKLVCL